MAGSADMHLLINLGFVVIGVFGLGVIVASLRGIA